MTTLAAMTEKLRTTHHADRIYREFSHDLLNLLMVISSYTQMVQQEMAPSDHRFRMTKQVLAAADRASVLTRQLSTYMLKQSSLAEPLDLSNVVNECRSVIGRTLPQNICLEVNPSRERCVIHASRDLVTGLLFNVCAQAKDLLHEGGRLLIETRTVGRDDGGEADGRSCVLAVACKRSAQQLDKRDCLAQTNVQASTARMSMGAERAILDAIAGEVGAFIKVGEAGQTVRFDIYFPRLPAAS